MNERIKQLIKQATNPNYDSDEGPMNELNVEKFAELIIQECIELNKQELAFNAFERMLNRYREHFGVE